MRAIAATLLAMSVLAAAPGAAASVLSVAPIRVELSSAAHTAVVIVRNQDDQPVVVQARPQAWSQHEGEDQLDDTHEVLVTPPLFTVPPKGSQLVRVALLRDPDAARELPFRLVLTEVPSPSATETTGLKVALRITLPIFIAAKTKSAPDLTWSHRWLPDGSLEMQAQNRGSAHLQILDFDLQGAPAGTEGLHAAAPHYLLPGAVAHWQMHPGSGLGHGAEIVLHGHSDAGDFTVTSAPGAP